MHSLSSITTDLSSRQIQSFSPRLGAELRLSDGGYGDMTHVDRWLSTARWLEREHIDFSYLTNLTGQDYPIRPMTQIHADLDGSKTDAFIQTFSVLDPAETKWGVARGRTRYEFRHRRLGKLRPWQQWALRPVQVVNAVQPWVRITTSTGLALGRRERAPWGDDLVLRGGSFFCTLSRDAVAAVLRFADNLPDVAEFLSGVDRPRRGLPADRTWLGCMLTILRPAAWSSRTTVAATSTSLRAPSTTRGPSTATTFRRCWPVALTSPASSTRHATQVSSRSSTEVSMTPRARRPARSCSPARPPLVLGPPVLSAPGS